MCLNAAAYMPVLLWPQCFQRMASIQWCNPLRRVTVQSTSGMEEIAKDCFYQCTQYFLFFFANIKQISPPKFKQWAGECFFHLTGKETHVKPRWIMTATHFWQRQIHVNWRIRLKILGVVSAFPSYSRMHTPPCQVYSFTLVSPRAVFHFKWVFPWKKRKERRGKLRQGENISL